MKKLMVLLFLMAMSASVYAVTAPSSVSISASFQSPYVYVNGHARHSDINSIDGVLMHYDEYYDRSSCSSYWKNATVANNDQRITSTSYVGVFPYGYFAFVATQTGGRCEKECNTGCGTVTDFKRIRAYAKAYTVTWFWQGGILVPVYTYSSETDSNTLYQGTDFSNCTEVNC